MGAEGKMGVGRVDWRPWESLGLRWGGDSVGRGVALSLGPGEDLALGVDWRWAWRGILTGDVVGTGATGGGVGRAVVGG